MGKGLCVLALSLMVLSGCGGRDDSASDRSTALSVTTTSDPCPPDELMSDSGCIPIEPSTSTTTMLPPEGVAFEAEYAKLTPDLQRNFTGLSSGTIAQKICGGEAELVFVGQIGVEHYPDLARAAYAWQCPERVKPHDDAVLAAIAEAERIRQEAAAAETQRQQAEAERLRAESVAKEAAMSASEFAQIQVGMSMEAVQALVGSPGEKTYESQIADVYSVTLKWPGEGGYGKSYAIIQFLRGAVFSKIGFGL